MVFMKKRNAKLLASLSMQNRMIIELLREIKCLDIKLENANNINKGCVRRLSNNELLIVEFKYLPQVINISPNVGIVVFNIPDETHVDRLINVINIRGMLFCHSPPDHLIKCIEHVCRGEMWLPRQFMSSMLQHHLISVSAYHEVYSMLTRREQQIFKRIVEGYSNQQIADELFVAESTIKAHIYKLYKKTGVRCRKEAVALVNQTSTQSVAGVLPKRDSLPEVI